eukprot:TRINITY_DN70432_c0_g1_i1.p1 TRINITY_DN70432_c0_g1~~TRINITY_DN70432_c0_g1_i1.p1  ORF type:complete len:770 (+),score=259.55 TRINITY_DN70432_c0_g1_i1:85-2310(+)
MSGAKARAKDKKRIAPPPALIIADSFTSDLRPVTLECPRTLVPVAGVALLDYALEALIANEVTELYVFCCNHSDRIEKHLREARWAGSREVAVRAIVSKKCANLQEALYDVHGRGVIKGDFLLITGDIIFNVCNMSTIWERHIERRKADPQLMMTLVVKEEHEPLQAARADALGSRAALPQQKRAAGAEDAADAVPPKQEPPQIDLLDEERITVVYDPITNDMLQYVAWRNPRARIGLGGDGSDGDHLKLDLRLLSERPTLQVRSDLVETGIAVCSQDLLRLFVENFDFRDMRDCIGCVINEELLGNKIAIFALPPRSFAKRIRTWGSYHAVSRAVVERWAHPLAADSSFTMGYHKLRHSDQFIFVDETAVLRRSCTIGPSSLLGPAVDVGEETEVHYSCIGRGSRIGAQCDIRQSQIWENVTIGDRCRIQGAVICGGAVIGNGCKLAPGCVVAFDVKLAPDTELGEGVRVTCCDLDEQSGDGDDFSDGSPLVPAGKMAPDEWKEYHPPACDAPDREGLTALTLDERMLSAPHDDGGSSSDGLFDDYAERESDSSDDAQSRKSEGPRFRDEIIHTVCSAILEEKDFDGVLLEIKALKFAANASALDCAGAVLLGLLQSCDVEGTSAGKVLKAFNKTLAAEWGRLITAFTDNKMEAEVELIRMLTEYARSSEAVAPKLDFYLQLLWDKDVVSTDAIIKWDQRLRRQAEKGTLSKADMALVERCSRVVELVQADTDEDSSESD